MASLKSITESKAYSQIRTLIWCYFWLLIFEGALRKWVLPSLANYLLLVRIPVVLAVYFLAIKSKLFKFSLTLFLGTCVGVLSLVAGGIVLGDAPAVVLYGFQANFLQLPMIYVISRVFNIEDVKKVGYWMLMLAIPMTIICMLQFVSSPHSFWNAGATTGGGQIASAGGHVRASGTFSFVSGTIYFFALVMAYLVYGYLVPKVYPLPLMMGVAGFLIVAVSCCASRSLLGMIGIIFVAVVISSLLINRKYLGKTIVFILIFATLGVIAAQIPFVQASAQILGMRLHNATVSDDGIEGTANSRLVEFLVRTVEIINNHEVPVLGRGLGVGTIGGAKLQTGTTTWVYGRDAEREWTRHILESGEILGCAMIFLRISIAVQVMISSLRSAVRGNILPYLLMSYCLWPILTDKLGQTSVLGFIVLVSGLCLAANRIPKPVVPTPPVAPMPPTSAVPA